MRPHICRSTTNQKQTKNHKNGLKMVKQRKITNGWAYNGKTILLT